MSMVFVKGKNEVIYDVDTDNGYCPCSGFKIRNKCPHLSLAMDLMRRDAKSHFEDIKQAFQVEVRRSSSEAYNWGRLIYKARGHEYFLRLCRETLLRETRNLDAIEKSFDPAYQKELISILIDSPKIHENRYFINHFDDLSSAAKAYRCFEYKRHKGLHSLLRTLIEGAQRPDDAYQCLYFVEDNPEVLMSLTRMLYDRAMDDRNWELVRFLELGDIHSMDAARFALELMVRHWHPSAQVLVHETVKPDFLIPALQPRHMTLRDLKPIFDKAGVKVRVNQKVSEEKIDLRFSNSYMGCLWRFEAFRQRGSIENQQWEDVFIEEQKFQDAKDLDRRYYPNLHKRVELNVT